MTEEVHDQTHADGLSSNKRKRDKEKQDLPIHFEDISVANFRIRDGIVKTACTFSESLSKETGYQLYFKHDHRQHTGSFKERGALNALLQLSAEQRKIGVIAASAGNHALALAYHGSRLGIPTTVVMPTIAPITKVSKCQQLGAKVLSQGNTFDDAKQFAHKLCQEEGLTYVNGFDDLGVIAGAGTVALEVLEQVPDLDAIVVPVGGGGLIAGVSLAIKKLRPTVEVIGVEPSLAASMTGALKAGKPIRVDMKLTLADGLAVAEVGENAFKIARAFADRIVTVSEKYIALSILRLAEQEKTVTEGAGAAGLSVFLSNQLPDLLGKKIVILLCGGNIDTSVLGRVIERGLAADGRLVRFEAVVSDRPGGLAGFTKFLADLGASVKDIYHERAFLDRDLQSVVVRCVCETRDAAHAKVLFENLTRNGYLVDQDHSAKHVLGGEIVQVKDFRPQKNSTPTSAPPKKK